MSTPERLATIETEISYIKAKIDSIDSKIPDGLGSFSEIRKRVSSLENFKHLTLGMALIISFITTILIAFVPVLNAKGNALTDKRFESITRRYKFKAPIFLETCGTINAFSDGKRLIICRELFEQTTISDDQVLLVMLHEEGHHVLKHRDLIEGLQFTLKALKPTEETWRWFERAILALILQNEYAADEYSYRKAKELNLPEETCRAIKQIDSSSTNRTPDSATHPAAWKRYHRCIEILTGKEFFNGSDTAGASISRDNQNKQIEEAIKK